MSSSLASSAPSPKIQWSIPFYAQYRTSNSIVVLKEKEGKLTAIIHDRLGKFQPIKRKFDISPMQLCNGSAKKIIDTLIQRNLFSSNEISFLKEVDPICTVKDCLDVIESELSEGYRYNGLESLEEKKSDFCCPITQEPFKDPVIDDHGHTFEKDAIERHLEKNGTCPVNQEPIKSLIPNRIIKEQIETTDKKDLIPSLRICKNENPSMAKRYLDLARAYEEDRAYREALQAYKKAFEYTKSSEDYRFIPALFRKMDLGNIEDIASRRLVQYQLEEGKLKEARDLLDGMKFCGFHPPQFFPHKAFVMLCVILEDKETLRSIALDCGKKLIEGFPREAEILYRGLIRFYPDFYEAYFSLKEVARCHLEKVHILLQGACNAIAEKNYKAAQELYETSREILVDDWLANVLNISILQYRSNLEELKNFLQLIGEDFRKRHFFDKSVKVAKLLLGLEESSKNYRDIISDYKRLQSPKMSQWEQNFSNYLLSKQDVKMLENPEDLVQVASALQKQKKIEASVEVLYHAIRLAFSESRSDIFQQGLKEIRELDPKLSFLTPDQRILLGIMDRLPSAGFELGLRHGSSERKEVELIDQSESKEIEDMPINAFGKTKWEKYIGDVGFVPPLPKDIYQILKAPCPFTRDKKVHETHKLLLIPEKVNGKPLTLYRLEELTKKPRAGNGIGYASFCDLFLEKFGPAPAPASHWVLITRDVIDDEMQNNERYREESNLTRVSYRFPSLLEATTAIFTEYLETGDGLWSRYHYPTYIRTQERAPYFHPCVGGSSSIGVEIAPFQVYFQNFRERGGSRLQTCGVRSFK